ncbi:PhzF family phenazine biosynthesis protein [Tistrella mobilis]|uniref:PhzF family phenazine biosynthesis protein n=1 Tax=Tistrella mobilis TaxID=171437 RepID=UPI003558099A
MDEADYVVVDVFTERRFAGNPVAIITDARGIPPTAMQQIAREFNFSETTFVLPPSDAEHTAKIRIFTPTEEVPFAGHPNIGTAFALARLETVFGRESRFAMRFEELAGSVDVSVERNAGDEVVGASIRAPQPLNIGEEIEVPLTAACASLESSDIVTANHNPLFLSVGLRIAFAEVRDLKTLGRATIDLGAFRKADRRHPQIRDHFHLFLYTFAQAEPPVLRARSFAPLSNIPEDPATGSASAALAAYLAPRLRPDRAPLRMTIEQGVEMGRPSSIYLEVRQRPQGPASVSVKGRCVEVMSGRLRY